MKDIKVFQEGNKTKLIINPSKISRHSHIRFIQCTKEKKSTMIILIQNTVLPCVISVDFEKVLSCIPAGGELLCVTKIMGSRSDDWVY
jgi:hypothetical protein